MSAFSDLLQSHTSSFITLTPNQIECLENHWFMVHAWNKRLNLTRISDLQFAIRRHYGESLFLASLLSRFSQLRTVADLGSGAGFPGIPIAVVRPDLQVRLVESHKRKAVFLTESSRALRNVRVEAVRFEDVSETCDLVVSRGVAWSGVRTVVLNKARYVTLLAGPDTLTEIRNSAGIEWSAPVPCPHSDRAYVVSGKVVNVPRETNST